MRDNAAAGPIDYSTLPWYRQFWPWFLIALPAAVVVAGFFTLYLAIKYSDDLVSDNYYRDGLAINQQLTQDLRATELGLSAKLDFAAGSDDAIDVLELELNRPRATKALPARLTLHLLHPTNAKADHIIQLIAGGRGRYRGQLSQLPTQRYYLRLLPGVATERVSEQQNLQSAEWRLMGEIDFSISHFIELQAGSTIMPQSGG